MEKYSVEHELKELKIKATLAYIGWLKGDDVVTPMNELAGELKLQGIDTRVISEIYNKLKR